MDNEFWGMEQAYYKAQRKELEDLRKENAELKALIHNGIRVKVSSTETKLYDEIHVWYGEGANGTLILWNKGEK